MTLAIPIKSHPYKDVISNSAAKWRFEHQDAVWSAPLASDRLTSNALADWTRARRLGSDIVSIQTLLPAVHDRWPRLCFDAAGEIKRAPNETA